MSIVIPARNEESRLALLLTSIREQEYGGPVEILVADGSSTDRTREIARSFGCVVVRNELLRAEPGVALGMSVATGDVVLVLAADNILVGRNYLRDITAPFGDARVGAVTPRVVATSNDSPAVKYTNRFTDPFNHFVYWDACSPWLFDRTFPIKRSSESYVVFDFGVKQLPLLALAQGFAIRRDLGRPAGAEEDDITPAVAVLERGLDVAVSLSAFVEHHTATDDEDYFVKFRGRIAQRLRVSPTSILNRPLRWSARRRIRSRVWLFYGLSFVLPWLVGKYREGVDRDETWRLHAGMSFRLALTVLGELRRLALEKALRSMRCMRTSLHQQGPSRRWRK